MTHTEDKILWTVGHSTHSLEEFIEMLKSFNIENLIDVRRFPSSRKFPQFNKEILERSLEEQNIHYLHLVALGGRRKANLDSNNTAWRNTSFIGYADYMRTQEFKEGLENVKKISLKNRTAIMCSEAVWWRCHRSMISDAMKVEKWKVMHIMGIDKANEHPYTQAANILNEKLSYEKP